MAALSIIGWQGWCQCPDSDRRLLGERKERRGEKRITIWLFSSVPHRSSLLTRTDKNVDKQFLVDTKITTSYLGRVQYPGDGKVRNSWSDQTYFEYYYMKGPSYYWQIREREESSWKLILQLQAKLQNFRTRARCLNEMISGIVERLGRDWGEDDECSGSCPWSQGYNDTVPACHLPQSAVISTSKLALDNSLLITEYSPAQEATNLAKYQNCGL